MRTGFITKFSAGWWLLLCWPMLSAGAATPVQFTLVRNYLIVVAVRVNDTTTADFLLDTGTNTTLIETGFARELGLQAKDRMELVTIAGTQIVLRAFLSALTCGEKTARNLEVLVSDLRAVRSVLPKVRGVLGQNFLSQFNFLVDFTTRRISFPATPEPHWCAAELPFTLEDGRLLVTLQPGLRFLLDSGINELVLFAGDKRKGEFDWAAPPLQPMQLRSDAGQTNAQQGVVRRLRVGSLQLQNLPLTLLSATPQEMGRVEEGLLPLSLFRGVYVDYARRRLLLNPQLRPVDQAATPLRSNSPASPDAD